MRRTTLLAVTAALAATALGPASAVASSAREYGYRVTSADISYTVDFDGAGAAGCAERGVCDFSGTATYRLPRISIGFAYLEYNTRSLRAFGEVGLFGRGRTEVTSGSATDPTPCRDSASQSFDFLVLRGRDGFVDAQLHPFDPDEGGPQYLDTTCGGPDDSTLTKARAVPTVRFRLSSFRRRVARLRGTSERSFEADGLRGTVRTSMRLRIRRLRIPSDSARDPRSTG